MIELFFNFLAEIIKCYFDHPPQICPIITVFLDIKVTKVNFSLKTLLPTYNIEHVFDFLGKTLVFWPFEFLGQKLVFWPIINVDLDIKVSKVNFSLKTSL